MKNKIILLVLSITGLSFSGYMSSFKLFTSDCAFNEPCPYFLGFPACYFGFTMFFVITIFSYLLLFKNNDKRNNDFIYFVSLLGIIFSGYFSLKELPVWFEKGISEYILILPTCALGLIFYIVIFIFALRLKFKK